MKTLGLAVLAVLSTTAFASEETQSPWALSATVRHTMSGNKIGTFNDEVAAVTT
ncbi:hypothetical protein [Pseudoalteromonas rubra]|uniref:hypothetical protein n=1 Tax=Pseudoalteromonas rubra TaxID=43658 RepID=UPI0013DDED51|nr:hypothetical protein [Pseudoalteromonas rubra]